MENATKEILLESINVWFISANNFLHKIIYLPYLPYVFRSLLARNVDSWLIKMTVDLLPNPCCASARSLRSKLWIHSAANRETAFPRSRRSKRWKLYYSLRTTIKRIWLRLAAHRYAKDPVDFRIAANRIESECPTPRARAGYLIFGYHIDFCRGNWMKRLEK